MLSDVIHRLRALLRRNAVEDELDEELRFHLERQVDVYVRQGLPRHEALRRARLEFGGLDQIREAHRDARGVGLVEDLARDVRYAVRQLRRSPGFAVAALLCLGLGIGATTAIFSIVNTILLQPLPFADSDRLVRVIENVPPPAAGRPLMKRGLTQQEFLDWRTQSRTLSDAIAFAGVGQRLVRAPQGAVGLWGAMTSANTFKVLGVRASLGRTFTEGDEVNRDVVVLSFDAWQRHFKADPTIVGTTLEFGAGALLGPTPPRLMTIIGILPGGFEFLGVSSDFYVPMANSPGRGQVTMVARLAPGASLEAAVDEANVMGAAMRPPWPADADPLTVPRFEVQRLKDLSVAQLRPALRVFVAAVVAVLLIVCANVANLLLARGTARQREISLRCAIGASRARIARQVMTESLVLALCGGAVGALLGAAGVALIKRLATVEAPGIYRLMFGSTILPRLHEVQVDVEMLGISFIVAALTSLVFGGLPAMTLSRTNQVSAMASHRTSSGVGESRMRAALVVGQMMIATVLLIGAGLLAHSFVKLSTVNSGYDSSNVLAFNLLFPNQYSIARKAETIDALLGRFRTVAKVQSAGFSRHGLLLGEELFIGPWVPAGQTLEDVRDLGTRVRSVSDGYLTAMGVPLLDGREFTRVDDATATIVMSRSAARQYFGTQRAIGQVVDWHFAKGHVQPMTVIGVVEDLRQGSPTDEVFPEIFVDYREFLLLMERAQQSPQRQNELAIGFLSFALRTTNDPAAAVPVVRDIVNAVDPNVGIDAIVPMSHLAASAVARERFYAVMLGVFASVAGLLAAIGVYGVLTYAVIQRTQEIGVRMALGAQRIEVLALVLRKGFILTTIGIAAGLVGAALGTRVLQGMLFGITPLDPRTFLAVSLLFGLVAAFACYLPARRATRVDALVALRNE
jgi:putative ABC transport system permease protein